MSDRKIKVNIDESLANYINRQNINIEPVTTDPDFIITESIPGNVSCPFVVIWEKHDVDKIEKLISDHDSSRYLRGFFLKSDLENNLDSLQGTILSVTEEINYKNVLKEKSGQVRKEGNYFEIGSLVKISRKAGKDLEGEFGNPRFTTLFTDKPMLELMFQLSRILSAMEPQIEKFTNHYKTCIDAIKKNRGIAKSPAKGVSTTFDENLINSLISLRKNIPVRLDPILLTGETGVGKTLIARWIHEKNRQYLQGSMEEINASSLTSNLLESELFGHVEGAWTDAKTTKPGKALLALGGVLFLDEIGDIPLETQPRVMKFIEEKTFTPEGWTGTPFYTPLLVIGATNKNLDKEIKKGKFRQDFYARFKHRVRVPSIEERKQSLPALVDLILQNPIINPLENRKRKIQYVSNKALKKLKDIKYEENFRGLERVIRDAAYRTMDYGLDIILEDVIEEG
jgi:hypothetical protein